MSWLFSRALVEEYSGASSSDGRQSVPWKLNPTALVYLPPGRMMEFSRLSRFGTTFAPLMEGRGEGLLTWYLAASRARTSAQREQTVEAADEDWTEPNRDYGLKCSESFAKLDRDGSWQKTPIISEQKVSTLSSKDWPNRGMMRNGVCYPLEKWVPTTKESGSGLLPTPTTMGNQLAPSMMKHKGCRELKRFLQNLPTPTAHNAKEGGYPAEGTRNTPTLGWVVGGKIHPILTEWMLGWPIEWTDLKPLETDKFQSWLQQHGDCLVETTEEGKQATGPQSKSRAYETTPTQSA